MVILNITTSMRTRYPNILRLGRQCGLCKVELTHYNVFPRVAFISGKAIRSDRPPRPPPFDWKNQTYKWRHLFTDPMDERFDDNSKIVIVEGSLAVGKDKFARKLAEELEMLYVPPPKFDDIFINEYGFDWRNINDQLPIDAQYFDDKMFLTDPYNRNTTSMQHTFYLLRFSQYIDALTHVFSTGQGVVLQRCPWSDFVFMKAMHRAGYVSNGGLSYYKSSLDRSLHRLLKPHLVIYLDIPSSLVKQRIQNRGLPHEINSQVLTSEYLVDLESNYKNVYLPDISKHAHLLIYNWIQEGDILSIVDDIEQLQFENYDRESSKMADWDFASVDDRRGARSVYANDKDELINEAIVVRVDVPEMLISAEDTSRLNKVMDQLAKESPGFTYEPGFDPILDKGVLWKTRKHLDDKYRSVIVSNTAQK